MEVRTHSGWVTLLMRVDDVALAERQKPDAL